MIKKSIYKILVSLIIIGLNWAGLSAVVNTFAYFSDTAISSGNTFTAGTLDFSLSAGEWQPTEKAVNLQPGELVTRDISVVKDGSLDFQYNARTEIDEDNNDINFCNALKLEAKLGDEVKYPYTGSGDSLAGLNFENPIVIGISGQDDWIFTITLSSGYTSSEEGAGCSFTFVFDAWQTDLPDNTSGFSDTEELENVIETGGSTTTFSGYSPIADAYVNEQNKNANTGGAKELQIRSEKNNKNKRTFIRFDFNFPSGTTILSSNLKLYMKSAPSTSRNYEVWRALTSWKERDPNGIDWNTQPAVDGTLTDSISSGVTKNLWLSWDVTSDVQEFVAGTSNYGWQLADSAEDSTPGYEAKFHSRESGSIGLRPILEVQFSVPEVATDHLVINEVYYHIGGNKGNDIKNEWVEIYNPTNSEVNISGWKICDGQACDTIPASSEIPSKGFAVITYKSSTWDKWPSIPSEAIKIVLDSAIGNGLANAGDKVILKNTSDGVIDAMSYGNDTTYFELSVSGKGKSLARIIKGYDNDSATDWIINATPNPGTNPSVNGVETLIFTSYGVAVAGYEPVIEENDSGEEEIFEDEPVVEEESIEEEVTTEENQEQGGIIEKINEIIDEVIDEIVDKIMPDEETGDEIVSEPEVPVIEDVPIIEDASADETPAVEEQPVIAPDNVSVEQTPASENGGDSGGGETVNAAPSGGVTE